MIKNYKQYNESLRDLMVGPTEEEVWSDLMNGKLKGLITSIPKSHEDFFNKMKDGCVKMDEDKLGIYFGKNGIRLFQQDSKNGWLSVSYKYIWSVFNKIYGFDSNKTTSLIKDILVDDINWKELTPVNAYDFSMTPLTENIKF